MPFAEGLQLRMAYGIKNSLTIQEPIGLWPPIEKITALEQIQKFSGLKAVNQGNEGIANIAVSNCDRELRSEVNIKVFLRRAFLDATETGKTTAWGLYGNIPKALWFLYGALVAIKSPQGFLPAHGKGAGKTQRRPFADAKGTFPPLMGHTRFISTLRVANRQASLPQ